MQGYATKKEGTPVIKCPRCHASNLTSQSKCGKCGFVFPHAAKKGKFDSKLGDSGGEGGSEIGAKGGNTSNFSSGGEANSSGGASESGEEQDTDIETEETPEEPPVPKHLIDKGKSEGLLSTRGEWRQCPRCGADLKPDMKRCTKCGTKIK